LATSRRAHVGRVVGAAVVVKFDLSLDMPGGILRA
jgi:hypothetical protein